MYFQPKEVSSPADLPTVPRTAATFPCCTAIEIHCRRYSSDLGSPVTCWLRSWMKERALGPNMPEVSTATGIKWWLESEVGRWAYLEIFRCSALCATPLASLVACKMGCMCLGMWRPTPIPYPFPWYPIRAISVQSIYAWWFQSGGDFGWGQGLMDVVINGGMAWVTAFTLTATTVLQTRRVHFAFRV